MKYTRLFLFTLLCCLFSFCTPVKYVNISIKQGVYGKVTWMEGNFMPSPDRQPSKESRPAVRTLYIYEISKIGEMEGEPPLFSSVKKQIVKKVKTDKNGYFVCKLAPGNYSIFTLEEESGKLFANLFDGEGHVAPFEVKAGEVTRYDIGINYKATY